MQLIRLGTGDTKGEWFPYESLSQLPEELYEQLDLDEVDTWWDKR